MLPVDDLLEGLLPSLRPLAPTLGALLRAACRSAIPAVPPVMGVSAGIMLLVASGREGGTVELPMDSSPPANGVTSAALFDAIGVDDPVAAMSPEGSSPDDFALALGSSWGELSPK